MKRIITALIGLFLSALAVGAGPITSAHVLGVRVDRDGKGLVKFDRPVGGAPASCGIASYSSGKAILALALSEKASGNPVTVYGTGTYATYGHSVEDWEYSQTE